MFHFSRFSSHFLFYSRPFSYKIYCTCYERNDKTQSSSGGGTSSISDPVTLVLTPVLNWETCLRRSSLVSCVCCLSLCTCMRACSPPNCSLSHQILQARFSSALVVAWSVWLLREPCGRHEVMMQRCICVFFYSQNTHAPFFFSFFLFCPPFSVLALWELSRQLG